MANVLIKETLSANESLLKNEIGESFDTIYRHFSIPAFDRAEAVIVYISGMIDARVIDETILEPLMRLDELPQGESHVKDSDCIKVLADCGVFTAALKETRMLDKVCSAVLEGDTALIVDQCSTALILTTRKYEGRTVSEPITETEIKGPHDGFIENIQTNAALIRRRIRDHGLRFDSMKIGERTRTMVAVSYIDSLVDENLLKEVKTRLGRIVTDGIVSADYIEELISDSPLSLFPLVGSSERPDRICAALLEGRIAILIDNAPFVIIVPFSFWSFLHSSGDYYESFYFATFIRYIRFFAVFLCISASSIYVLLTSFHQEMLPTALALKIAAARNGVPFPAVIEAFVMEIVLEIMKEAGLRLPKSIGQAVSIVGTLVIGQAAVTAGLVSPLLVIVIAVAAISSFAIPTFSLSNTFRLIRFPVLFSTAFFGLLGYLAAIAAIFLHLMSLRSFGTPYLSPVIPFDRSGNKDVLIRVPWWKMNRRPELARPKDKVRQAPKIKPGPPPEE